MSSARLRLWLPLVLTLVGCGSGAEPLATPVPTPSLPPMAAPTLTPTATPTPTLSLTIRWPESVSALTPVSIEVEVAQPAGPGPDLRIRARIVDPGGHLYQRFELTPQEGGELFAAGEMLQLPLEPPPGDWRLALEVQSEFPVTGTQELRFTPAPILFHELTGTLPAGVQLRVPRAFEGTLAQGDPVAGGRSWTYGDGEVALWWAPGPTKELSFDNALVMAESTYDPRFTVEVRRSEELDWQGRVAFLFHERWRGMGGGPAEALVVQGPDLRLYVLRVRALGGEAIPSLLQQVGETFGFAD